MPQSACRGRTAWTRETPTDALDVYRFKAMHQSIASLKPSIRRRYCLIWSSCCWWYIRLC